MKTTLDEQYKDAIREYNAARSKLRNLEKLMRNQRSVWDESGILNMRKFLPLQTHMKNLRGQVSAEEALQTNIEKGAPR